MNGSLNRTRLPFFCLGCKNERGRRQLSAGNEISARQDGRAQACLGCEAGVILDELRRGDLRREITQAALGQDMCATAAAVFVWSAVFERCKWKYGQRAYRYIYLDAGHIAENLALATVSLNLGSCEIGALFDDEVNAILGIDGEQESTILMAVVGPLE